MPSLRDFLSSPFMRAVRTTCEIARLAWLLSPLVLTPHLPFGFAQGRLGLMNAVASRLSFKSIHEANSDDLRDCAASVVAQSTCPYPALTLRLRSGQARANECRRFATFFQIHS